MSFCDTTMQQKIKYSTFVVLSGEHLGVFSPVLLVEHHAITKCFFNCYQSWFLSQLYSSLLIFFYISLVFHPDFSGPYESSPAPSSTPTMTTFCCLLFLGFFIDYRECYGFERAFFTLGRFLHYTLNQHLVHEPPQPAFTRFYQSVLGSRKFSFKEQGLSLRFGL